MVDRLSDNHSYFLNPQEAQEDDARYVGEDSYIGVGVDLLIPTRSGCMSCASPRAVRPSGRGFAPTTSCSALTASPRSRTPANRRWACCAVQRARSVRLTIRTPGKAERELTVSRAVIRSNVLVDYQLLPGSRKVGYVRIAAFDEKTIRDKITDAVEEMMNQSNGKMDGLILDVRQNGGGTYPQLASALGLFTKAPPGEFVNRRQRIRSRSSTSNSAIRSRSSRHPDRARHRVLWRDLRRGAAIRPGRDSDRATQRGEHRTAARLPPGRRLQDEHRGRDLPPAGWIELGRQRVDAQHSRGRRVG